MKMDLSSNAAMKNRRKMGPELELQIPISGTGPTPRWSAPAVQQTYSIKLLKALRHTRRCDSASGGSVREVANTILAVSGKGRTQWSRAIITTRRRLARINNSQRKAKVSTNNRLKKRDVAKQPPSLQRKVGTLGRLVPGCRRLSFQELLEETSDYIAALEMQVQAMTFLAELLTAPALASTPPNQHGSNGVGLA